MPFTRVQHTGAATLTTLASSMGAGDSTAVLTDKTNWPDGTVGPFYAVIDPGSANEEKVLATALSGSTLTGLTRGADGTSAVAHAVGAPIQHIWTANEADEANRVAVNTLGKVAAKGDVLSGTGANALGKTPVGADGVPLVGSAANANGVVFGPVSSAGIATDAVTAAKIAASAVGASEIADLSVGTAELADNSVTSAKIAAGAVALADLSQSGYKVVQICTSTTRPASPGTNDIIYETDTGYLSQWTGSAWKILLPSPYSISKVPVTFSARTTSGDLFNWTMGPYLSPTNLEMLLTFELNNNDMVTWDAQLQVNTAANSGGTQLGVAGYRNVVTGLNARQQVTVFCDEFHLAASASQTFYLYVAYSTATPTGGFVTSPIGDNNVHYKLRGHN